MVILIRSQLSFGLSAAQKGQAETFVFHYIEEAVHEGTGKEPGSAGRRRCKGRESEE